MKGEILIFAASTSVRDIHWLWSFTSFSLLSGQNKEPLSQSVPQRWSPSTDCNLHARMRRATSEVIGKLFQPCYLGRNYG